MFVRTRCFACSPGVWRPVRGATSASVTSSLESYVSAAGRESIIHLAPGTNWSTHAARIGAAIATATAPIATLRADVGTADDLMALVGAMTKWKRLPSAIELDIGLLSSSSSSRRIAGNAMIGLFDAMRAVSGGDSTLQALRVSAPCVPGTDGEVDPRLTLHIAQLIDAHGDTLRRLEIPWFPQTTNDAMIQALHHALMRCTLLQTLDVTGCRHVVNHTALAFGQLLSSRTLLQSLHMSHTAMQPSTLLHCGEALRTSRGGWGHLMELSMSHQPHLNSAAMTAFIHTATNDVTVMKSLPLQLLHVSECRLDSEAALALSRVLEQCESMRVLDVSRNALDASAAASIGSALLSCAEMEDLSLARNRKLKDDGIVAFVGNGGLRAAANLRRLDLSYVGASACGLGAVCDALQGCSFMTHLSLEGNDIGLEVQGKTWDSIAMQLALEDSEGDELRIGTAQPEIQGASDVGKQQLTVGDMYRDSRLQNPYRRAGNAMELLTSLESLNLGATNISDDELANVTRGLIVNHNTRLTSLDVSGNAAIGKSSSALLPTYILGAESSIPQNICRLSLAGCASLGDVGLAQLCEDVAPGIGSPLSRCSPTLTHLNLSQCRIGRDGWDALLCDGFGMTCIDDASQPNAAYVPSPTMRHRHGAFLNHLKELRMEWNTPLGQRDGITLVQLAGLIGAAVQYMPKLEILSLIGTVQVGILREHGKALRVAALTARGCEVCV